MRFRTAPVLLLLLILVLSTFAFAQEHQPAEPPEESHAQTTAEPHGGAHEASGEGAGKHEEGIGAIVENVREEGRKSFLMGKLADSMGLSRSAASWISILLNFAILALLLLVLLKKNLPGMFRARTESIRKGIDEASRASADANQRLAQVESRLAKLDQEVAEMRAAAEADAAAEEQRIQAATEEDKRRIVDAAQAEIEAAAKTARRELKAFAADLSVTLAERRIRVDSATDKALVRSFVQELGDSAGKDGK